MVLLKADSIAADTPGRYADLNYPTFNVEVSIAMRGDAIGNDSSAERLRKLVEGGAEIAGATVGGAIGFLFGAPLGSAVGGATGATAAISLRRIGEEIAERVLGPREHIRAGAVLALAAANINQRLIVGETLRSDGFFRYQESHRSDAEEVAEGVLLRSQREAEERKLPYMAHLLAEIAFDPTVSAAMGQQLIKAAGSLTYRQFCIMKLAVFKEPFNLRADNYREQTSFHKELRLNGPLIDLGLPPQEMQKAILGLGSSYRAPGEYEKSKTVFQIRNRAVPGKSSHSSVLLHDPVQLAGASPGHGALAEMLDRDDP